MNKEYDWNGPIDESFSMWDESDLHRSILDRFLKIIEQYPNNIAIYDEYNSISYKDLYNLSCQISHQIQSKKFSVIGIYLPAGSLSIASMIASLSQGIPYIPLDINLSGELISSIISDSKIDLIITDSPHLNNNQELLSKEVINLDTDIEFISFVSNNYQIEDKSKFNNVACIIYTSGTTGNTKGVYQSNRILLKDIMDYTRSIHINENDVLSWFYSPSVGGAIRDIYGAILNGASLVVMNPKSMTISKMLERTQNFKVTIFHAIPSLLRVFLNHENLSKYIKSVRIVYIAGDKFFADEIAKVFEVFPPNCIIYNGIGATECTTLYCQWFIRPDTIINSKILPVGYPTKSKVVRILDENDVECEIGGIGEAVVESEFIALGYWQNEELSKEKFRIHPENQNVRIYRTGDLFKKLEDGNLEYIGRMDKKSKVHGYMIDLNMVEALLRQMIGIKEIAIFTEIIHGENILIVVYEQEINYNILDNDIKNYLKGKVQDNHIPNFIFEIEEMPLLHNLKYDYKYLRNFANQNLTIKERDRKCDDSEDVVTKIWNKHLPKSLENKEITFDILGGDSLTALKIISELENYYPNLNNGVVHAKQTLSNLKNELLIDKATNLPELFIFPPRAGTYQSITNFTNKISNKYFVRIVKYPDINDIDSITISINELAKLSSKYIKKHAKSKNLSFVGLSFGSRISHDTACILSNDGYEIDHIVWDAGPYFKNPYPKIIFKGLWSRIIQYQKDGVFIKLIFSHLNSMLKKYFGKYTNKYFALLQRAFNPDKFDKNQGKILHESSFYQIKTWIPMKYESTLYLLYSANRESNLSPQLTENYGWNNYANEVKIYKVNSNHVEIFEDDYIDEFVKTIEEIIGA
jgi:fengycin family lipopeptide synthetase E